MWRPPEKEEAALGSRWISGGLIFWTYITLLAIHVALSSIAVLSFSKLGVLRIHLCSIMFSVILLGGGVALYGKLLRYRTMSGREQAPVEAQFQASNETAMEPTLPDLIMTLVRSAPFHLQPATL
jgi:hypothetical protein